MDGDVFKQASDKALRYLGYAPRTEKELRDKLNAEGFEAGVISEIIGRMKGYGYIDDAEYARAYISEKSRLAGRGYNRIRDELVGKGIDGGTVDEIWNDDPPDEEAAALELLRKRLRGSAVDSDKERRRQTDYLLRRGFDYEKARDVIRKYNELL